MERGEPSAICIDLSSAGRASIHRELKKMAVDKWILTCCLVASLSCLARGSDVVSSNSTTALNSSNFIEERGTRSDELVFFVIRVHAFKLPETGVSLPVPIG